MTVHVKSWQPQDGLRARISAAKKLVDDARLRWGTLCAAAGLSEPPDGDGYELSRAASARLKTGAPSHPTDSAYTDFLKAIDAVSALRLELARSDTPPARVRRPGPMYRKIDGERVRIYRKWELLR